MQKLTTKQSVFVDEYLKDINGTQAAIRAGYAKNSAHVAGSRLLRNDNIIAALKIKMDARAEKAGLDAEWVLNKLKVLADASILDYAHFDNEGMMYIKLSAMTREQSQALRTAKTTKIIRGEEYSEVTADIQLIDTLKPLEMIAKHLGMFKERVELTGAGGGPIEIIDDMDFARRIAFALARAQNQKRIEHESAA